MINQGQVDAMFATVEKLIAPVPEAIALDMMKRFLSFLEVQ